MAKNNYMDKIKNMNSYELTNEVIRIFSDKYAECKYIIEHERDQLKAMKMRTRLALGNTDFSDLI